MNIVKLIDKYIPMTEATYYVLLALVEPKHGYGVMKYVDEISNSRIRMAPGTLYGVLGKMESEGIITILQQEKRKKVYGLTKDGRLLIASEIIRLEELYNNGQRIFK